MWVEAILMKEDLSKLVGQFLPVSMRLGDADEGELSLTDPSDVSLVAGSGLRVVCKAKVHWPVLGIDVPVTLNSLTILLRPEPVRRPHGDAVIFKLEIEHADLAGVPSIIDNRITEYMNKELDAKHVELTWEVANTLAASFELPGTLKPLDALKLGVAGVRVKVTTEALGIAVLFDYEVTRLLHGARAGKATTEMYSASRIENGEHPAREGDGEDEHTDDLSPTHARNGHAVLAPWTREQSQAAIAGGVAALAVAGVFGIVRSLSRRRRLFL
jgi:hypothetical protein